MYFGKKLRYISALVWGTLLSANAYAAIVTLDFEHLPHEQVLSPIVEDGFSLSTPSNFDVDVPIPVLNVGARSVYSFNASDITLTHNNGDLFNLHTIRLGEVTTSQTPLVRVFGERQVDNNGTITTETVQTSLIPLSGGNELNTVVDFVGLAPLFTNLISATIVSESSGNVLFAIHDITLETIEIAAVPIPGALPMMLTGVMGLVYFGNRRRQKKTRDYKSF